MSKGTEVKGIILRNHNIFMADSNSNPVRVTLFDLKMESFIVRAFLETGFHDGKLVSGVILRFYMIICDNFYVWML